jgi:hypothetical protein
MSLDVVYLWCGLQENSKCPYTKDIIYSVKSVKKYVEKLRIIWIVVDDEVSITQLNSHGIDTTDLKIKIVKYRDFMPKKYLPILWNSNVLESWIWKIKGLSEKFLYMCDDMYIGKKCSHDMFYHNDMPIVRIERGSPNHSTTVHVEGNDYLAMWQNAIKEHNIHYTRLAHNCMPYKKSLIAKYYKIYKKHIDKASYNTLRSGKDDFNLLRFTGSLSVMNGDAILIATDPVKVDYFVEAVDKKAIKNILKIKPQFFCINNTNSNQLWVYETLEAYFKNNDP